MSKTSCILYVDLGEQLSLVHFYYDFKMLVQHSDATKEGEKFPQLRRIITSVGTINLVSLARLNFCFVYVL